jgi:hypothetical protein
MIPDTMEYEKGTSVRHWWGMVGSLNLRLLTILRPYLEEVTGTSVRA